MLFIIIFLCIIIFFILMLSFDFSLILDFLSLSGNLWVIEFSFDKASFGILTMLFICTSYVFFYSIHYFGDINISNDLNSMICIFVGVMTALVLTNDFLSTLIFWEYLGVVSFFLILFYSNYLSLRSSIITLVSSRFGDVCLFLLICVNCFIINDYIFGFVCYFLIIFSKSAGFPFISWLLEAMRAPTPVSSLVHSSTLVAAGVWFIINYDYLIFFDNVYIFSVLLLLTIFITGVCNFYFVDLKKMVALSTCNNISWCVFYFVFGDIFLSLFQLISHGVSKCVLFMLVGDQMSGSGGSQSSNCIYSCSLYGNWNLFSSIVVIIGLCGVPFIGVFFTKHFLLSNFVGLINFPLYLFVLVCVFLSYLYSFRFCVLLSNTYSSISTGIYFFFGLGLIVYFWLFVNYFMCSYMEESILLNGLNSLLIVIFQFMACIMVYLFYENDFFACISSNLFGCDNLIELFYCKFFNFLSMVSLSFYRWDNFVITMFNGIGVSYTSVYVNSLLNIIMVASIICMLFYYVIIY
uniref:NADH:ubiquinone reductase (H(+)-translocating) n=1 Tax=Paruterina candelabraria TaxID=2364639 RepID=A0A386HV54_9CEST|nr:NADH dehydrogenase subunit 5 [Paruterina candelabraria]AYD49577.1 NADH dehydrogenase subunit 5 [Paruterina candelabraria]